MMKLILIFLVSCIFLKASADSVGTGGYGPLDEECTSPLSQCGPPRNRGVCRVGRCRSGENNDMYSNCDGANCICCIKKQTVGTGGYGPLDEECTSPQCGPPRNRGVCRVGRCRSGESNDMYSNCDGANCICCITKQNQKCTEVCPTFYEAVCGSDGKTYSNRCEINKATCQKPYENIVFRYKGICDGGSGPRPDLRCASSERPCGKRGKGVCRTTCFDHESVSRYSQCDAPNCKCCKSEDVGAVYAIFLRMTEDNDAIRGNISSIAEDYRAIQINISSMTEVNKAITGNLSSMAEDLTLTKTKLEKCKTSIRHLREVDISRNDGSTVEQTSATDRSWHAWGAFDGTGMWGTSGLPPQEIWIRFGNRPPVKVLSYTFKSHDPKTCKTQADKCRNEGPSRYEFFGSNSTDCRTSHVVLHSDHTGTAFTPDYNYRSGTVENPGYYSCYGFKFIENPGGGATPFFVRHVRLYH